jgi:23S rRNA (uridine2552-2'-O)-methyltransferase
MTNNKSHQLDPHYQKAKQEGYRARSAYKLLEIQKRFNIFKRAFNILDLGCAPGSWLQVAKKYAEDNLIKYNDKYYHREKYVILGVDLKKVSPIENVSTLRMDFTNPDFQNKLDIYFEDKIDLILSDASINKTGNKFSDHLNQINLCYAILELANIYLKFKGILVMKTFQGSDYELLIRNFKPKFRILKTFKPESSKKKSNEIYLIGLQKR